MSAAVRYEDHFGPIEPLEAGSAPTSAPSARRGRPHEAQLHDLVAQMHLSVVRATTTVDIETKVGLWASYRAARARALAMMASVSEADRTSRLHSV
ncbi:MAG: hypothetical protein ABSC30_06275 [Acidimicrobiales bacterium]|jgi:hypothetical protein